MHSRVAILFFVFTYFQCYNAQTISSDTVKKYLTSLCEIVWERLREYDLSNLPDVDRKVYYNISMFAGYNLQGYLYLEDGFVMDIWGIDCTTRNNNAGVSDNLVSISSELTFKALKVLRSFRYEPDDPDAISDEKRGNVLITPTTYGFYLSIRKDLTNSKLTHELRGVHFSPGTELLNFMPTNGLTSRLKKKYRTNLKTQGDVFEDLEKQWIPIFEDFFKDAINKVPFPELQLPTSRS